ncbi:GCG_CRPN prefix-to-repeats domain-containing protein [Bradyrhizobium sp. HKCCYLS1011]|uniref:GCG_CRPN prefix-to-repeats domain-containing protein n=1 Tax=Bradyrhizobium sp. HKCCYLS1011 TaxID=3420733 RepID=UPI003EBAE87A
MAKPFLAALFVAAFVVPVDFTQAADGCGPGCHLASNGGCTVDGWDRGAPVWNECPAGIQARPPCGTGFTWSKRDRACRLK